MSGQIGYGVDLSGDQIDDALYRLTQLMAQEEVSHPIHQEVEDEDDILKSIQDLAIQVSNLEFPPQQPQTINHNTHNTTKHHLNHHDFSQMVQGMYNKQQNACQKIEAIRQQQQKSQTHHPQLSQQSKKIIQRKIDNGQYQPIHQRAEQIQAEKRYKYEKAQQQKSHDERIIEGNFKTIKQESQHTFKPKVTPEVNQEPRSVEQFLQQVDYFINKRNMYIEVGQKHQLNKELEGVTFKPQVNANSERIVSQSKQLNTTVQDRLNRSYMLKQLKEKKMIEDEVKNLTFKPKLNTNSMKIAQKVNNNKPGYQRLHQGHSNPRKLNLNQSIDIMSDSYVLGINKNIQNTQQNTQTQVSPRPQENKQTQKMRSLTPPPDFHVRSVTPPPSFNEIKYQSNMKFIVDLVGKKKY